MTWLPLRTWKRDEKPDKIERMSEEGGFIWEVDPVLNELGKAAGGTALGRYGDAMILSKRKRSRQLLKFRKSGAVREYAISTDSVDTNVKTEGVRDRMKQRVLFPLLMRMQRRPIKELTGFEDLKTVTTLRNLTVKNLTRLLQLAQGVLNRTSKSIFMVNFKSMMKKTGKVVSLGVQMKTPLFALKGFEKQALRRIRTWCSTWRRQGIVVLVHLKMVQAAAPSIISLMDTSQKWAKKSVGEAMCPCKLAMFDHLRKLDGHVLQPLREFLEWEGIIFPKGWTVRSRLLPEYGREMDKVEQVLTQLGERLRGKLPKGRVKEDFEKNAVIRWDKGEAIFSELWTKGTKKFRELGIISVDTIVAVMRSTRNLTCSPIDKFQADGMLY
jgi:hypothetical protein